MASLLVKPSTRGMYRLYLIEYSGDHGGFWPGVSILDVDFSDNNNNIGVIVGNSAAPITMM